MTKRQGRKQKNRTKEGLEGWRRPQVKQTALLSSVYIGRLRAEKTGGEESKLNQGPLVSAFGVGPPSLLKGSTILCFSSETEL